MFNYLVTYQQKKNYVALDTILNAYQDTSENFFKSKLEKLPEKQQQSLEGFLKTCPLESLTKRGNIFVA